jgi:UDP-glucose 4-epimerase
MDKVVVIGGSGFIGSHTADILSDQGFRVVVFDNKPSKWLRGDQEMVIGSILDKDDLDNVINGAKYVYHFAGISDIGESRNKAYETINLNIMGTVLVIESCLHAKVERLIYASTLYVYSTHGSFYRASKLACEKIIEIYNKEFGFNYTFLRYGSLYGPRSQDWNGLKGYVNQAIQNKKIKFSGNGKERREYIHVVDASILSVSILDDEYINSSITVTGQQILNANELLELIFEILGTKKNVEFDNSGEFEHYIMSPYEYHPQNSKKIVPRQFVDIGEGLLEIIKEINSNSKPS